MCGLCSLLKTLPSAVPLLFKEWNPDWSPKYFMCDYADEEINALGNVFPGILIIMIVICLCKHTI
jgi:hypothetical protein